MVDCDELQVASLDPENDDRAVTVQVARHAALLIAKAFKIKDRPSDPKDDRRPDKDAADDVRITTVAGGISATFDRLAGHPKVGEVAEEARNLLLDQFGFPPARPARRWRSRPWLETCPKSASGFTPPPTPLGTSPDQRSGAPRGAH
ncbi:hypothetical protein BX265_0183 [Streptomyces sp. TLI_235]|nr:hypothetical protein [Streptomyces sp. TLI_235]PBC75519.1 hypothetical protein BX265_0183 [Streptomyces sp. TLI_235]